MDQINDFADTAALIVNLDLIISVDTSIVHLAGALGKPVWMLDRFDPCWRWLKDREDSPWYPYMRIFRQKEPGNWAEVIVRVKECLGKWIENFPCPPSEKGDRGDFSQDASYYNNQGNACLANDDLDKAYKYYCLSIEILPDSAELYNNKGLALLRMGCLPEAEEACSRAVSLNSELADAHLTLACILLAQGKFIMGWPSFEWRWHSLQMASTRRNFVEPQWMGEEGNGRTLLIHAEQGLGDSLQFCRYASIAATKGWKVLLEIPTTLIRLLSSLRGVDRIIPQGTALPDFDLHCPMLSLPLALKTDFNNIPAPQSYLRASFLQRKKWQERLINDTAFRVGLSWAGNPHQSLCDSRRSIPPDYLAPLFACKNISFYSLQKGGAKAPAVFPIIDMTDEIEDFEDTAAIIEHLDLVISVDSAVVHLAGALGKPVWLLDRFDACWRWLRGREDSPWYPSLRIFRQTKPGDWKNVISRVKECLDERRENLPYPHFSQGKEIPPTPLFQRGDITSPPLEKGGRRDITSPPLKKGGRGDFSPDALIIKNHYDSGQKDQMATRYLEAINHYKKIMVIAPSHWMALANSGICLHACDSLDSARELYQRALCLAPEIFDLHSNLGIVMSKKWLHEEGVLHDRRAIILQPDLVSTYQNLGYALLALNRLDESEASSRHAVNLNPHLAEAWYNLSHTLLAKGNLREGWYVHEWRKRAAQTANNCRHLAEPQWMGENGNGRRLFIHAEQGHGDSLQFCRYVSIAASRGWKIILEAQPLLVRLLGRMSDVESTIPHRPRLPAFDVQCPMLSLPLACRTELENIPNPESYLTVDEHDKYLWKKYLDAADGHLLKVGLVWAGNPRLDELGMGECDRRRSIPPEQMSPLFTCKNVRFYSLQKTGPFAPATFPLIDFMPSMQDFADTAAFIANLDLIISVDTAVVHLAGSLGKKVWLLNRFDSCWRWLRGRNDSPWYHNLRIFRQTKAGEWGDVIKRVQKELKALSSPSRKKSARIVVSAKPEFPQKSAMELCRKADAFNNADLPSEAMESLHRAIISEPDFPESYTILSRLLSSESKMADAITIYQRDILITGSLPLVIVKQADCPAIYNNIIEIIQRPGDAILYNDLGGAYLIGDDIYNAYKCYCLSIKIFPNCAEFYNNKGLALSRMGRMSEAEEACYKAVSLNGELADAQMMLACLLLAQGKFITGWSRFEWRWHSPQMVQARRNFNKPQWMGEEGEGRTLLIHAEQGYGDSLQFCRYASIAAAKGWKVLIEIPTVLVRLLSSLQGVSQIIPQGMPLPDFDFHCPMLSLPLALKTDMDSIPAPSSYLRASSRQRQKWRRYLANDKAFKVGLCWAGNPRLSPDQNSCDSRRSIPTSCLEPLFACKNIRFYSLQKDGPKLPDTFPIVDMTDKIKNFEDTAALVDNLDLVISVDSAVVHLAGALGKPVWLLDRFDACWRWMRGREDSPWYPSLRIFRQTEPGDWIDILKKVQHSLLKL